jgi:phenylpropionate dioxygenase-like ring-hydroxylating dioxygenase large terminal subunit
MQSSFLRNVWYVALPSSELKINKMRSRVILGEPIVFYRDSQNKVFGLRDICPHRRIPLSYGLVIKDQVEYAYHGWKFNSEGTCTEIPSLCKGQDLDCTKIKVRHYPVREQQGLIWVFCGDQNFDLAKTPKLPFMKGLPENAQPRILEKCIFPCHIDHAVIGLMDPAHGP